MKSLIFTLERKIKPTHYHVSCCKKPGCNERGEEAVSKHERILEKESETEDENENNHERFELADGKRGVHESPLHK